MPLLPRRPPITRRHTEELLRQVGSGLQLLALSLFAAGVVAPFFNTALNAPLWLKTITVTLAFIIEGAALTASRYIPFPNEP